MYRRHMKKLLPYGENTILLGLEVELVRADERTLVLRFLLSDPDAIVRNGPVHEVMYEGESLMRAHELWKDTCFECFWGESGKEEYYECNLSVEGKWNVYRFDSYRNPAPPKEALDYRVTKITTSQGRLEAEIVCDTTLPESFNCSLTAILNTKDGELFYALTHAGNQPDFHIRESFVLTV